MRLLNTLMLCLLLAVSTNIVAKGKYGELKIEHWENREGTARIPLMKLRYKLGTFFGEPTEKFVFYYESPDKFTEISSINLSAQVLSGQELQDAYIKINPLVEVPGKWGWDIEGSPNWDSMFYTARGEPISEEQVKGFYKAGLSLTNLKIDHISARSGKNDEAYDDFASLIPASYVRPNGKKGPLDGKLPDFSNWGVQTTGGFWKNRISAGDINNNHRSINVGTNVPGSVSMNSVQHVSWKYGLYQHAAIELFFSKYTQSEESQAVEVEITWNDWKTGKTKKRKFRRSVKKGQRMVVADRIHRPERKDGSLTHFNLYIYVSFPVNDEEEKDPLKDIAKPDPLEAALEQDQIARYEEVLAEHKRGVDQVHHDNEQGEERRGAEKEASRLAAEKSRDRQRQLISSIKAKQEAAKERKRKAKEDRKRKAKEDRKRRAEEEQKRLAQERARAAHLARAEKHEQENREMLRQDKARRAAADSEALQQARDNSLIVPSRMVVYGVDLKLTGRIVLPPDSHSPELFVSYGGKYFGVSFDMDASGSFGAWVLKDLRHRLTWVKVRLQTNNYSITREVKVIKKKRKASSSHGKCNPFCLTSKKYKKKKRKKRVKIRRAPLCTDYATVLECHYGK